MILGTCVTMVRMFRKGNHTFTEKTLQISLAAGKSNWRSAAILFRLLSFIVLWGRARWHISHAAYGHERLFLVAALDAATMIQRLVAVGNIGQVLAPLYTKS